MDRPNDAHLYSEVECCPVIDNLSCRVRHSSASQGAAAAITEQPSKPSWEISKLSACQTSSVKWLGEAWSYCASVARKSANYAKIATPLGPSEFVTVLLTLEVVGAGVASGIRQKQQLGGELNGERAK